MPSNSSLQAQEKKKKEARAERKDGRKEVARRRTRARPLLHGGPFFFGGFPLSFLLESGERRSEGRRRATELRKRGTTSRARVSARTSATEKDPLLRPYYIVYLSTASTTSLSRPSSSSSLLPPHLLCYLLALRLLVSRNKQLPFSLAYKSGAYLRTCPSRRMTVNRSRGDHRDVLPGDRKEKRRGIASPLRRSNREKCNAQADAVVNILNQ